MRGALWRDIQSTEGLSCWAELSEAGALPENRDRWTAVQAARSEQEKAEIRDTGRILLATSRAELPSREEDGDAGGKPYRKRVLERSASAAQAGAALLDPATHGKQAGKGVTVNVNNQMGVGISVELARELLQSSSRQHTASATWDDVPMPPARVADSVL
jgi:hypothetical protein